MIHTHRSPDIILTDELVIPQGADWRVARALKHNDGTHKNFDGWSGALSVYSDPTCTDLLFAPLTTSGSNLQLYPLQGLSIATTTLDGDHAAGLDAIELDDVTDIAVGQIITIDLNEVAIQEAKVIDVQGDVVTISQPLLDPVLSGAIVTTWDPNYMLANFYAFMPASLTAALEPWGIGYYQIDLTDPFGRKPRIGEGTCCLASGGNP